MSRTRLEELRQKQASFKDLKEHFVSHGLFSYETSISLSLDSPNHNATPIDPKWFRQVMKEKWNEIVKRMNVVAQEDIAALKHQAIIESGSFLREVGEE